MNGHPVQIETLFTFAFETKISNPLTILNNKEARELAAQTTGPINIPAWVHSGTQFTVRIHVTQDGKVSGTGNTSNLKADLFFSAAHAVSQWLFHPYLKNGKLDEFLADITFTAP